MSDDNFSKKWHNSDQPTVMIYDTGMSTSINPEMEESNLH